MKSPDTFTVEDYIVWCVQTLSTLDDGLAFDEIQTNFNQVMEKLHHLEACLNQPSTPHPHEADQSN